METKKGKWFIEPIGDVSRSNEVLIKNLKGAEGSTHQCNDGKPHYLYDCTGYTQAKSFWDSRRSLQIDIRIWFQEEHGKIKPHKFLLTKSPVAIAVKKQITVVKAKRNKPKQPDNETDLFDNPRH